MPSDTDHRTMQGYDVEIISTSRPPGIVSAKGILLIRHGRHRHRAHPDPHRRRNWLIWAKLDTYAKGSQSFPGSLEQAIAKLLEQVELAYSVAAGPQADR